MVRRCALVGLALWVLLTGCGGSADVETSKALAKAIRAHSVTAIYPPLGKVRDARCQAGGRSKGGGETYALFDCEVSTVDGTRWLVCTHGTSGERFSCADGGAPPGTRVFTTPAQIAAAKDVTWKCFDVDEAGHDVGAVYVTIRGQTTPVETLAGDYTRAEAKRAALRYHAHLDIDCP